MAASRRAAARTATVTSFRAADGTEQACRAVDALDGVLGLSRPGTARLLVIVSGARFAAPGEMTGVSSASPPAPRRLRPPRKLGRHHHLDRLPGHQRRRSVAIDAIARALTT